MSSEFVMPSASASEDVIGTSVEAKQKEELRDGAETHTEASKVIEGDYSSRGNSIDENTAAQDAIIEELKEADLSNIAVPPSTRRFIPRGQLKPPVQTIKVKTNNGK